MSTDKITDLEAQYNKIYRYCYFKLQNRETAEDITQETFLRFLESNSYRDTGQVLHYLYSIARNLCINEYHRPHTQALPEQAAIFFPEEELVSMLSLRAALSELEPEDQEMLLLRYANEVPVTVICKIFNMSRFALYRKISKILKKLRSRLKEDFH